MKAIERRLDRLEDRLAPEGSNQFLIILTDAKQSLALDSSTCVQILRDAGHLDTTGLSCVVDLGYISGWLNAAELEEYIGEHGKLAPVPWETPLCAGPRFARICKLRGTCAANPQSIQRKLFAHCEQLSAQQRRSLGTSAGFGMASDVGKADIHEVLERHQVRFEVHPYYTASPIGQRVQAGYDVDLYGTLETWHLPLYVSEEGHSVVDYFESLAEEIQLKVGHQCRVEILAESDSLTLDVQHRFRPQARLRIQISHDRGLNQPKSPAEEQALQAIRERLHELKVREA